MSDMRDAKIRAELFKTAAEFEQNQKLASLKRLAGGDPEQLKKLLLLAKKIGLRDILHPLGE